MSRGVVQLLAVPPRLPALDARPGRTSTTLGDLVQYVLGTFLLYLRVSGQFHLIVGMLHLFGFHLPETHHLYFLASSFTDFWRRINIYWKDFMMKLVFYPSFFRLRQLGDRTALVGATLDRLRRDVAAALVPVVLAARRLSARRRRTSLFWGVLGVLVVIGIAARDEARSASARSAPAKRWDASLAMQHDRRRSR